MASSQSVTVVVAFGLCVAPGCLPAGNVPVGQHVFSDRTIANLYFVPAEANRPTKLIIQGPSRIVPWGDSMNGGSVSLADLYVAADGTPANAAPAPRITDRASLLLENSNGLWSCWSFNCGPGASMPTDALGRIFLYQSLGADFEGRSKVIRVDPSTGQQLDLGVSSFELSASRTRVVMSRISDNGLIIVELDDRQTNLEPGPGALVGDDYYFLGPDSVLRRSPAAGPPEIVLQDVGSFSPIATQIGPLLSICHIAPGTKPTDFSCSSFSFFDPATGEEATVPGVLPNGYFVFSPDGRKVLLSGSPRQPEQPAPLSVFDRFTGTTETINIPADFQVTEYEWRPLHDELWLTLQGASLEDDARVAIWKAGQELTTLPGRAFSYFNPSSNPLSLPFAGSGSIFTSDGSHWFTVSIGDDNDWQRGHAYVRPADDPAATGFLVNPTGTGPGLYWELQDHRLLVEAMVTDSHRNDISILDPNTGAARSIASGGHIIALGKTRALAVLKWYTSGNSGDLTLIDLATGATTLLAEGVFAVSMERGALAPDAADSDGDPLAPGARVAFLVKNRFVSPYDGLWIATLP